MEGLIEGRVVHYVLPEGPSKGEHRPAQIVKVWSKETGLCNLVVTLDGMNDGAAKGVFHLWATSCLPNDDHELGTWHWIERG